MALTDARLRRAAPRISTLAALAAAAALACLAPTLATLFAALQDGWRLTGAEARFFGEAILGTLMLCAGAGAAATALGVLAAWLASACEFPGRRTFEWALALPLAAPSYVLAYAYGAITGPLGPAPIGLAGAWGAGFVYAVGLYPYVYLSARAAFVSQSTGAMEAARTLGVPPWPTFHRVVLPMAWPGIAAGATLAVLEIAAEYGAAQYFGAFTVTTAVFRAWFARADPALAVDLAAILLLGALVGLALERHWRGRRGFAGRASTWGESTRFKLSPAAGVGAFVFCAALLTLGALAPLAWLARLALMSPASDLGALARPLVNTLALATAGAALTLPLAWLIAAVAQRPFGKLAVLAAAAGYAAPGAVAALGALAAFSGLRALGLATGLSGAAAIALLLWAYASRFAAAGAQPLEAGLTRVTSSMRDAARTLEPESARRFLRVELPVAAPAAFAAALIVWVETLKELPATLLLRPFDFETVAIRAYVYASDERLAQAAAPSLLILLAGLLPMTILSAGLARSRAGRRP